MPNEISLVKALKAQLKHMKKSRFSAEANGTGYQGGYNCAISELSNWLKDLTAPPTLTDPPIKYPKVGVVAASDLMKSDNWTAKHHLQKQGRLGGGKEKSGQD